MILHHLFENTKYNEPIFHWKLKKYNLSFIFACIYWFTGTFSFVTVLVDVCNRDVGWIGKQNIERLILEVTVGNYCSCYIEVTHRLVSSNHGYIIPCTHAWSTSVYSFSTLRTNGESFQQQQSKTANTQQTNITTNSNEKQLTTSNNSSTHYPNVFGFQQ